MATVTWHTAGATDGRAAAQDLLLGAETARVLGRDRLVIHVAREHRTPLVVVTARALIERARSRPLGRRIEVIDAVGHAEDWNPASLLDLRRQPRYRVDGACGRGGVSIPALWFEPFSLVTIAAAAPDPRYRVSAILAAQAPLLDPSTGLDLDLMFEAHRLVAPDLAIVCGSVIFGAPMSGSWWAVSDDDVVLEMAVAAAAGADPTSLPQLRRMARHETLTPRWHDVGSPAPRLQGYLAPPWRTALARSQRSVGYAATSAIRDVIAGMHNLQRLPQFVRRRWPFQRHPDGARV